MSEFEEFNQASRGPEKTTGDIINHAFENYKGIIWTAVVVIILMLIVSSIISSLFGVSGSFKAIEPGADYEDIMGSFSTGYYLGIAGVNLLSTIIFAPLFVGLIYICHQKNIGKPVQFSDVFIGYKQNTINIVIFSILFGIIQSISIALCLLPAVFIMPLFFLGYPFLLFENANAIEAFRKSIDVVKQDYWTFVGVGILSILISYIGILACGIGLLFTYAFVYAAMYSAYVAYVGVPRQVN